MEDKRKSILHCESCMYFNAELCKCDNENGQPHPQADDFCPYGKRKGKPATILNGKCGSCIHAVQVTRFGSTMYVKCTNPNKFFNRDYQAIKQRTNPACKKYTRKENAK